MHDELTQSYLKECLHYCPTTGLFTWKTRPREHFKRPSAWANFTNNSAGNRACRVHKKTKKGYTYKTVRLTLNSKMYIAARMAWFYMTGSWPENQIDHIDGDSTNNRWDNLRDVTQKVNSNNLKRFKNNTSGVSGVYQMSSGKWRAQASIKVDGKFGCKNLGTFLEFEEAVAARKAWEDSQGVFSDRHGTDS